MIGFVGVVLLVVVGIHLYLWKRLVRDPLRPGAGRKAAGFVMLALGLLVPATLILVRAGYVKWLAWPGYLWLALMFYLLVTLVVLEIPRLVINVVWRVLGRRDREPATVHAAHSTGLGSGPAPSERTQTDQTKAEPAQTDQTKAEPAQTDQAKAEPARTDQDSTAASEATDEETPTEQPNDMKERPGIERRLLLARGAAIFAGLTAASVTGYGVRTALGGPQLDRVQIPLARLPRTMDGTRLAVVSDIHLGPLTGARHMGRIVEMINSVDADVVCIVGDMVDGTVAELGRYAAPLADIRSRQGAYFVTGNHEYYSGFQQWVDEVDRLGVRPLRNERLEIVTRGGAFDLAGVNDLGGTAFGDGPNFETALGDRDPAKPVVLMAHQPVVARDAAPYGVDLQVSGHTHGGQMVPFNYLVKLQQPVVSGYGEVDGVPVYVTNGAGFWGPPVRVGAPPQVTLVELKAV
ncbi:metallophosphoesterase [Actinoplanes sp. NBRC 103695]|uniref:metallophosphoesterase n=1 Tax=Actinoplanes sp. NBRC 103695 TaxID=3032202 RepID=UPI0024A21768|nr:metallophosphoesterase [Actinoplanes sp. NBRC 103695]GLZ01494.1 membrane protein [Actinoplanes sp. NBRC 103695]